MVSHLSPRALVKEMLQSSSLYSIASFGPRLGSIVLVAVLTRHLSPADYGALDLLEQIAVVSATFLGVNFSDALGYFYFHKDAQAEDYGPARTVTTTLVGSLFLGMVASAAGMLAAPLLSRAIFHSVVYVPYVRVVFGSMAFSFLYEAATGWLRIENRTRTFVLVTLGRSFLAISLAIVLVAGFGLRIAGVIGANVITLVAVAIPLTIYAFRTYRMSFDRALFVRMLRYAVPLGIAGLALFIIHFGDRFILPQFRSLRELGIYALAYKFGMLLSLVHGSFHTYWTAQVFRIVQRQDADVVLPRVFTYMVTVLSFCALGLIVAASPLVLILAAPPYAGAIVIIPVIVAAYFLRAIGDFFRPVFFTLGRPANEATVQWIGAVICLAGYFTLIPRYGAMGAAVATLITFGVIAIISISWVRRLYPFQLETVRLAKLAAITGTLVAVHFLAPVSSTRGQIGRGALLLAAYVVLLGACRVLHQNEWDTVMNVFRRLAGRPLSASE